MRQGYPSHIFMPEVMNMSHKLSSVHASWLMETRGAFSLRQLTGLISIQPLKHIHGKRDFVGITNLVDSSVT